MPSSKAYTRIECLPDYWCLPHASTCKTYGGPNWLHQACQRVVSRLPTTPRRTPHRTAGRTCGAGVPRAIVAHDSSDRRRSDRCSPRGGARHRSAGGLHSTCGAVARSPAGTRTGSRAGGPRPPGPPEADRAVRCGTTRRGGASGSSRPANEPTFQPWPHLGASRTSLFPKETPGASPPLTGPDAAGATFGGLSTSYVWKTGGRRPTTLRPGCGRMIADMLTHRRWIRGFLAPRVHAKDPQPGMAPRRFDVARNPYRDDRRGGVRNPPRRSERHPGQHRYNGRPPRTPAAAEAP